MKKFIPMIILVAILLAGCQLSSSTEPTEPYILPTQAETEPIPTLPEVTEPTVEFPEYEQQPMLAVSMPYERDNTYSDSGEIVFYHSYQTMQLILEDPEVGNTIILDYLNRMEEIHDVAAAYADSALEAPGADPYFYDVFYSPARIDANVLSLGGVENVFMEGQSWQMGLAANYNMLTGEVLTLGSILTDVSAKETLSSLVIAAADSVNQELELFPDYADCIAERFDREESFDEDWYFTETGLAFYFSTYEIAPYSTGMVTLEVPYTALTGVIDDGFFPPEEEVLTGEVNAVLFSQANLSEFNQIAEVIVDEDSEKFLLSAAGAIQNLQIHAGAWDDTGTAFIPECTIFACTGLTPGDAVVVQTNIPDTMPTLQITYHSDQQQITCYLFQSGEDGSAILVAS